MQQVLNVAVLGFWCGSCLSYASLISFTSNGLKPLAFPIATLLLIVAFVYPLFGKKSYYCANVCPFGSLQELAGRCVNYRIRIGATTAKRLDRLRQVLWAALMLCLWTGVWFDWVDIEPFSAFIPVGVPFLMAARRMFPVEIVGIPSSAARIAACVPFPAPGAPNKISFMSSPFLLEEALVLTHQHLGLQSLNGLQRNTDNDDDRGSR